MLVRKLETANMMKTTSLRMPASNIWWKVRTDSALAGMQPHNLKFKEGLT